MSTGKRQYFAYRSFWPELETVKEFRDAGVNTICFFASNTTNSLGEPYCLYPPIWPWRDTYDFEPFDKQIEDFLNVNPDAEFLLMVDLNSPLWLARQQAVDSMSQLGFVLNNDDWKEATVNYMRAFLEYVEKNYGDKIVAYILACGGTDEWQDRTHGKVFENRENAFARWNEKRGRDDLKLVPRAEERNTVAHEMLRDPVSDRDTLDYLRFLNENTVDVIQYFIKEARKLIRPEVELGVFYGYIIELAYMRHNTEGYLEYERLCDTPGLDFLIGPGTYQDRKMGGGSGYMVPRETLRLKGLQYMHENDQRTHGSNFQLNKHLNINWERTWADEASTIAGVKREMAMCVIEKTSMWWFDMWGGFYKGEKVMATFKKMKEIWDRHSELETEEVSEILMVVDPESSYYLDENNQWIDSFIRHTRNKLNRVGAPFRVCSFDDLDKMPNLDQYKFIVFTSSFLIDDNRKQILKEKVLGNQRSVLWLYGPGIVDGKVYDTSYVKDLCGAEYKSTGLQTTEMDNWRSSYIYDPRELTPAHLKRLAEEAGVNVYCEKEVPVYANNRMVAIHTAEGGSTAIRLPRVCGTVKDLFSGEVLAENTDVFNVELNTPDTALFELSED